MKSVVITGSSRGIGLELVKQLLKHEKSPIIIAACRNPLAADELQQLSREHKNVYIIQLDTTKFEMFDLFAQDVEKIVGDEGLNLLINNAGINKDVLKINDLTVECMTSHYLTNTVGPVMLTKALIPVLKKAAVKNANLPIGVSRAAVINVTSVLGSLSLNCPGGFFYGGYFGYRESKAALNMATRSLSAELTRDGILVTMLHPGYVQTDMGGPNAYITVETSASSILKTLFALTEKHESSFVEYTGNILPW